MSESVIKCEEMFYDSGRFRYVIVYMVILQESVLNGRLEPVGTVEGFSAEIGASGAFCPSHLTLPVTAFFYHVSEDDAPSPFLVRHVHIVQSAKISCKKGNCS